MTILLRAAGMRGLDELMNELGVALGPWMDRYEIPRAALHEEELRISLAAYAQMMERLSELAKCPDLGLRMAERQDISILGPIAIAMQNAATVGDAVDICSRYLHTHSPGIRVSVHADTPQRGETSLRITVITPGWLPRRQLVDQCLADLYHFIAWLAQDQPPISQVWLPHVPLAEPERYAQLFGAEVVFEQPHAQLIVPSAFLAQSLQGASAALHQLSLDYLRLAFQPGNQTVGERVEEVLRRALSTTRGRREVVAKLLGLHPRTLQRRLADEGRRYQDIVDAVRRERAQHWLTESDTPLAQVAVMLGLADQTVLCRNCQRWFGRTPAAVREAGVGRR